ncbi:MAG: response regulator [Pseudomonadota bacterium]
MSGKRRIIYIEKEFQRQFIIKFCLITLLSLVLASALAYLFSQNSLTASYSHDALSLQKTADAIIPSLAASNIAVLLGVILTTVALTLYVSFRIGGPLYALRRDFALIGQGNLKKRVKFRKGDQLINIADSVNEMVENLEWRVVEIRNSLFLLNEKLGVDAFENTAVHEDVYAILNRFDELFTLDSPKEMEAMTHSGDSAALPGDGPGPGADQAGRILVVDDNRISSQFIFHLLKVMGHHPSIAEDGLAAIKALEQDVFDLVIMDIEMPVMNGVEATQQIRKSTNLAGDNRNIPIIALTAHSMESERSTFIEAGLNEFMSKPIDLKIFKSVINSFLHDAQN